MSNRGGDTQYGGGGDRNNGFGSGGNRVGGGGRVDGGGCSCDQRGGLPRMKLATVLATSGSGEKSPYDASELLIGRW